MNLNIRIKEASTWKGILYLITSALLGLFPAYAANIVLITFALSGIIGILFSDAPYTGPTDVNTIAKTSASIVFAILFSASIASANPFFVVDRDVSSQPATSYIITLPSSQSWLPATAPALTTGNYGVKLDLSNAPVGPNTIKIRSCLTDPLWGQVCNADISVPFTRPSNPLGIANPILIP